MGRIDGQYNMRRLSASLTNEWHRSVVQHELDSLLKRATIRDTWITSAMLAQWISEAVTWYVRPDPTLAMLAFEMTN